MARRPPPKLYKIGEVMDYTGLTRQTVHSYTMLGLIQAAGRTKSGHRLYGEETFDRLEDILKLKKENTLLEIKEILNKKYKPKRKGK